MPDLKSPSGPRSTAWMILAGLACGLTLAAYLALKQFSYRPTPGDEHIYYYMAKVIAEGKAWPYRDFFFAHPPLQLLLAALAFKVFGCSLTVANTLPIAAGVAAGLAIFAIGWRRFGPLEAVVAQAAFLLSFGVLRNSSHYTGGNLAVALLFWAAYLLIRKRDVSAGLLIGLSMLTAVYMAPGALMLLLWRAVESPRRATRAGIAAFGIYGGVTLVFLFMAGGRYLQDVFLYHFSKQDKPTGRMSILSQTFRFYNFHLTAAAVTSVAALVWRGAGTALDTSKTPISVSAEQPRSRKRKRPGSQPIPAEDRQGKRSGFLLFPSTRTGLAAGLLVFVVANLLWMTRLRELYDYYLMIVFGPLALLTGYATGEIVRGFVTAWQERQWTCALRSGCLCTLILAAYAFGKNSQIEQYFSDRGPENMPKPQQYVWFDAPHLGALNGLVRGLLWSEERDPLRGYLPQTYYLWHEMRHLEDLGPAVEFVCKHSGPKDRIFGESGLAPLVAFLSDRDLVAFMADTNTKRLSSGQLSVEDLLRTIDVPELRFVIASKRAGRYEYINRALTPWLDANFKTAWQFRSGTNPGTTWLVLERKS